MQNSDVNNGKEILEEFDVSAKPKRSPRLFNLIAGIVYLATAFYLIFGGFKNQSIFNNIWICLILVFGVVRLYKGFRNR
jgi:hypothetical protein